MILIIFLPGSENRLRVAGVAASLWAAGTASPPSWTTTDPPSHRVHCKDHRPLKYDYFIDFSCKYRLCNVDLWSCNILSPTQWYPLRRCRETVICVPHLFSCESGARTKKGTEEPSWCVSWMSGERAQVNNPGPNKKLRSFICISEWCTDDTDISK